MSSFEVVSGSRVRVSCPGLWPEGMTGVVLTVFREDGEVRFSWEADDGSGRWYSCEECSVEDVGS